MPGSFSTVLAHMEPPSSRKQAKRVRLGPKRTLLGAPDVLGEPRGADLVQTTPDWPAWVGFMVTTHFDLVTGPFWAYGGSKRARFGPERPFWGLRRSEEGPGGPDLVPTALKWSDGVKLMVTTHFDLISGPLRVPRGPKGVILAQSLNFHVPIFWGILFVSNIGLWGVQTVAAECLAHPALL